MIADDIIKFTFSGDPDDPIKRLCLGMYSYDRAFITAEGEIGMPLGTGYEVFGAPSVGKSTYCYSMMGIIGKLLTANGAIADLEGFDPKYVSNILRYLKYTGTIKLITQGTDEEILSKLEDALDPLPNQKQSMKCEYTIGLLDSIAAISPVAERDGDLGGANMGRRAFLMAQFTRRLLPTVHPRKYNSENIYFFTNHWYDDIGKWGFNTPGGEVKKYLCGCRIHLKREKIFEDGSYTLLGTLYKNRYGINKKQFYVFIKSGVGIHLGLTALYDGIKVGKVNHRKPQGSKTTNLKLDGKKIDDLEDIITKRWQDDEFFQPFYDALKEYGT